MINVVLMAGKGQRFTEKGYTLSKPLIPVSGKPMILRATESMPPADNWVFVVRQDHMAEKEVIETLKKAGKNVTILVDENPIGQLNSALVARKFYENDEPLFIGACDFGMVYDQQAYQQLMTSGNADMVVWSFTRQPNLTRNPQAWGWLRQDGENRIHGVSVKVPISNDPFHDYAIEGSFSFKSGKVFLRLAKELMEKGIRVKNEFYIDSLIDLAVANNLKTISFPVRKYIGWGTPADYEEYLYWEKMITQPQTEMTSAEVKAKPEYSFWNEFFTKESLGS